MELLKYAAIIWILPLALAAGLWYPAGHLARRWARALVRSILITLTFPLPVQLPLGGRPTAILPGYYSWIGVFYVVPAMVVSLLLCAVVFGMLLHLDSD